ncbi:MAG TPA: inorganic diphosphatase [Candidatus Dormibacteraeota bacterium]|jgi:inorganic pyrophosphatase|nr:inorganic diphosphatase [Candidatus Dormibacteraeota bacterium]
MSDPVTVDVVVEVPKGSRNKFEWDPEVGAMRLDRELFTATRYPADYGFVVGTLGEDGDPVDALVLLGEATFPGCHVFCRPLGVFWMTDEHGPDAKLLMVPSADSRVAWTELDDVPESLLLEIAHFFEIYKELEPGKVSQVRGWDNRAAAEAEIRRGRERLGNRP